MGALLLRGLLPETLPQAAAGNQPNSLWRRIGWADLASIPVWAFGCDSEQKKGHSLGRGKKAVFIALLQAWLLLPLAGPVSHLWNGMMMLTWEEGQRCNVCVQGLEIEHRRCDGHRKHCCYLSRTSARVLLLLPVHSCPGFCSEAAAAQLATLIPPSPGFPCPSEGGRLSWQHRGCPVSGSDIFTHSLNENFSAHTEMMAFYKHWHIFCCRGKAKGDFHLLSQWHVLRVVMVSLPEDSKAAGWEGESLGFWRMEEGHWFF